MRTGMFLLAAGVLLQRLLSELPPTWRVLLLALLALPLIYTHYYRFALDALRLCGSIRLGLRLGRRARSPGVARLPDAQPGVALAPALSSSGCLTAHAGGASAGAAVRSPGEPESGLIAVVRRCGLADLAARGLGLAPLLIALALPLSPAGRLGQPSGCAMRGAAGGAAGLAG